MAAHFQFEADFVDSLRCIPMQVRYKLDTCGIKLKLFHWHQMSQQERQTLVELPCNQEREIQAYRQYIQGRVLEHTGQPVGELPIEAEPAWMDGKNVPPIVQEKAGEMGVKITCEQWENLIPLQRFALIKLSRSGHENSNFPKAIVEFGLCESR